MKRFGVGQSTIYDEKDNKESILAFASQRDSKDGSTKRKTMKLAENEKLEEAMYVCSFNAEVKEILFQILWFMKKLY